MLVTSVFHDVTIELTMPSISFSHFFARENFMRENLKERENLVRTPPTRGYGL